MKKISLLAILVAAIFLSIIDRGGFFNPIRGLFQTISTPIQIGVYRSVAGIKEKLSFFTEIGSLRNFNTELLEENIELKSQIAVLKKVEEENKLLKEQAGVTQKEFIGKKLQIADITGFSPLGTQSRLILNKGKIDGVKPGDLGVLKDNLIGRIIIVTEKTSTLQLLTDPEMKLPAVTVGGAKGLLVGQFGSEIKLTKVLQQEKIEENELVLTIADSGLPKNLVLGKISTVLKDDKEIFQEARIEYLIPVSKINQVFILNQ